MWVKICANTNLADAQLAVDLGANALGFVFAPSPRQVTARQVRTITDQLVQGKTVQGKKPVETVAVVQTQSAAEIVEIIREAGLNGVQLHGNFSLLLARELRERLPPPTTITQVLHWVVGEDAVSARVVDEQLQKIDEAGVVDRVLLDTKVGKLGGGSGRSFDWVHARIVLDKVRAQADVKLVLAGGLRPENLNAAVEAIEPWGVDVASGVEASAGLKDPQRLKEFLVIAKIR